MTPERLAEIREADSKVYIKVDQDGGQYVTRKDGCLFGPRAIIHRLAARRDRASRPEGENVMSKLSPADKRAWRVGKMRREEAAQLKRCIDAGLDVTPATHLDPNDRRSLVDLLRGAGADFEGGECNLEEFQVVFPAEPPTNCCCDCVNRWIKYVYEARLNRTIERRAVECSHHGGEGYNVAFLIRGKHKPHRWLQIAGIEPSEALRAARALQRHRGPQVAANIDGATIDGELLEGPLP